MMISLKKKKKTFKNFCQTYDDMHYFNVCYFTLNINLFIVFQNCKKTFEENMKKSEFKKEIKIFQKIVRLGYTEGVKRQSIVKLIVARLFRKLGNSIYQRLNDGQMMIVQD